MTSHKKRNPEMKTSIWQVSSAFWYGTLDECEARALKAQEWLKDRIPEWIDEWSVSGRATPDPNDPDKVHVYVEFNFDFLTELEHGKHDWRGTASEDPKLIEMRILIDRLSNYMDLVGQERFNPNTTGAVYDY